MVANTHILSPADLENIRERVERVRNHLKQATSSWLLIAAEFSSAKTKMHNLAYQRFAIDAGFTTGVADKLSTIGRCSTLYLEDNLDAITSVDGWTVLYDLATLAPKQRDTLLKQVKNENLKITREVIHNFKYKKSLTDKRLVVASIEIDDDKLKTLTRNQFDFFQQRLKSLEAEINKVNAGLEIKQRTKVINQISSLAGANSDALIVENVA